MHVIWHQMPFHHLRLLVLGQLPEDLPEVLAQRPENLLLAPLGDEYHVVFAVPSGVTQTLVLFHR